MYSIALIADGLVTGASDLVNGFLSTYSSVIPLHRLISKAKANKSGLNYMYLGKRAYEQLIE